MNVIGEIDVSETETKKSEEEKEHLVRIGEYFKNESVSKWALRSELRSELQSDVGCDDAADPFIKQI